MPDDDASPRWTGRPAILWSSVVLACFAVVLCGIPFVPPSAAIVVPVAAVSLLLLLGALLNPAARSVWRILVAGLVVGINLFALWLALTGHHLIDWLEGH